MKRVRNPALDGVKRKEILKTINTLCKKVAKCPHCGDKNGKSGSFLAGKLVVVFL